MSTNFEHNQINPKECILGELPSNNVYLSRDDTSYINDCVNNEFILIVIDNSQY
jgi:hypothetical protein